MKPFAWALFTLIATMTVLVVCVLSAHAQTAIVGPDGRITYIVPYGPGLPSAVIPPAGGQIYHVIPMTPPAAYVPPPVYVPPPMPAFVPPSFNSPFPYGGY